MTDILISLLKGKTGDKVKLYKEGYGIDELLDICNRSELKDVYRLGKGYRFKDFETICKDVDSKGIKRVLITDNNYPKNLKEIYNPPFLLYLRGEDEVLGIKSVSIVGTRKPTIRGYHAAYQLGIDFGKSGITVVSGLALGVDTASHLGNIAGGGKTLAVLGNGIDTIYPKSNSGVASDIVKSGGAIISEFPPGEGVRPYNFPKRNRIVAGLSSSIVIVQAPGKSGSLITGDMALEGGRDVWVHSSGVGDRRFLGSDKFHKEGARILERGYPLLNEMNIGYEEINFQREDYSLNQLTRMEIERKIVKYRGEYFKL